MLKKGLAGSVANAAALTLYVEGPRDRSILRAWAYRLMPGHARRLFRGSVILGGRQPDRAVDHFRSSGANRGLCILDRDGGHAEPVGREEGLEFFTWSRRHIESYLLVPGAIRRVLGLRDDDRRVERAFAELVPDHGDHAAWGALDAKRLLDQNGELPRALGAELPLTRIARATREDELHPDVLSLFDQMRSSDAPPVVDRVRSRTSADG